MRPAALVVLALGCNREVAIVSDDDGTTTHPPVSSSTSTPDSSDATGAPPLPGRESDQPCELAPTGFDDDLPLTWCQRVTPEADQVWPGQDAGPRCGMFNLIGDFGLAIPTDPTVGPTVLYCDSDPVGGIRTARYDSQQAAMKTELLAVTYCSAWPNSGVLAPLPSGEMLGAWPELETYGETGTGAYALRTARLDPTGYTAGPWDHGELPEVRDLELPMRADAAGEPLIAFALDFDDHLTAMVVSDDGETVGPALPIADDIAHIAAAPGAEGIAVVATCERDVVLRGVDASGAVAWTESLPDADCDDWRPPGLASLEDGTLAVGWGTEQSAQWVEVLGPDRVVRKRLEVGSQLTAALVPRIAPAGDRFVVMAADGLGIVLDADGNELARFHHPAMFANSAAMSDIGLWSDGTSVVFAPVWQGAMYLGPHVYTYDVIEVSAALLPN